MMYLCFYFQIVVWVCSFVLPAECDNHSCGAESYTLILYIIGSVWFVQLILDRYYRYIYSHSLIGPVKHNFERKIVNIFLPISLNICFGCSKEPPQ